MLYSGCRLVGWYRRFGHTSSIFRAVYRAPEPRRTVSSFSPPWEPQISQTVEVFRIRSRSTFVCKGCTKWYFRTSIATALQVIRPAAGLYQATWPQLTVPSLCSGKFASATAGRGPDCSVISRSKYLKEIRQVPRQQFDKETQTQDDEMTLESWRRWYFNNLRPVVSYGKTRLNYKRSAHCLKTVFCFEEIQPHWLMYCSFISALVDYLSLFLLFFIVQIPDTRYRISFGRFGDGPISLLCIHMMNFVTRARSVT
jgi:hypothetical protein